MSDRADRTDRFVCIHGHFYQPPRENPWLESVERQDSAYPYHDWNARIAAECYAPNARAAVLDDEGWVVTMTSNYERISFDLGPTLLKWLADERPTIHDAVVEADRRSADRFGGHGSAMALPYNHTILPLDHPRDRRTQIRWGIADFRHRFGRDPEGMWLPETAVDVETLEALAEHGIRFTVLAPHQVARVRSLDGGDWRDVERLDGRGPYLQRLPSGRSIALYFYHGSVSHDMAFGGLLQDGRVLAGQLLRLARRPGIAHVAIDGETFGHHHRHGEMALAAALDAIDADAGVALTNYAHHLAHHPPREEVQVAEETSWSCAHGIERWRSDCGCNAGRDPTWHQRWRRPLREALRGLRERLAKVYESRSQGLLRDPWAARDDYIHVVLDRSPHNLDAFLEKHAEEGADRVRILRLLEMQRHALLMFTSCGWFFDDVSGIETTQVLQYAARAVQLAEELTDDDVEGPFLDALRQAPSNHPHHHDAAAVYDAFVRPAAVDLRWVAAQHAMTALFRDPTEEHRIHCYRVEPLSWWSRAPGRVRVAVGRVRVTSVITLETAGFDHAVIHFGDHSLHGGVRPHAGEEALEALRRDVEDAVEQASWADLVRLLDRHFEGRTYELGSLFQDEKQTILEHILGDVEESVAATYGELYEEHAPLLRFLAAQDIRPPPPLALAATTALDGRLRHALREDDAREARRLLDHATRARVELDPDGMALAFEELAERRLRALVRHPEDLDLLDRAVEGLRLVLDAPFDTDLRGLQALLSTLLHETLPSMRTKAEQGLAHAARWLEAFRDLSDLLRVRLPA